MSTSKHKSRNWSTIWHIKRRRESARDNSNNWNIDKSHETRNSPYKLETSNLDLFAFLSSTPRAFFARCGFPLALACLCSFDVRFSLLETPVERKVSWQVDRLLVLFSPSFRDVSEQVCVSLLVCSLRAELSSLWQRLPGVSYLPVYRRAPVHRSKLLLPERKVR